MTSVPEKACKTCAKVLPATPEFFYQQQGKWLQGECRECAKDKARRRYQVTADAVKGQKKRSYASDPEPFKVKGNARYRVRRAEVLAQHKTPEAQARRRASAVRRYWANPEAKRLEGRLWRANNREASRIHSRRSRVKRHAAPGKHTAEDVRRQYAQQQGRCHWCASPLGGEYEVDHIIPLSRGGTDNPNNICCACEPCNRQKHAKMPWDFAGRLF